MKKARDYFTLDAVGLPIPIFGVFDSASLVNRKERLELSQCVEKIHSQGSGIIGVRTEPKESNLAEQHITIKGSTFVCLKHHPPHTLAEIGGFPHYLPLYDMSSVVAAMKDVEEKFPHVKWWFLINEGFVNYKWNAVVRVTSQLMLPGGLRLDGEVNYIDNLPLRPALLVRRNTLPAQSWYGKWPGKLRELIISSGLLDVWIEVSLVLSKNTERLVFWGLR